MGRVMEMTEDELKDAQRVMGYAADTQHIPEYWQEYDRDRQFAILAYLATHDPKLCAAIVTEAE